MKIFLVEVLDDDKKIFKESLSKFNMEFKELKPGKCTECKSELAVSLWSLKSMIKRPDDLCVECADKLLNALKKEE